MKPLFMAILFLAASLSGCTSDEGSSDSEEVVAIFSYEPNKNIRTGEDISFDAGSSLPSGVTLTYKWDFNDDGSYDESGRSVSWSYPDSGSYKVQLTVSDGSSSHSSTKTLTVADADAVTPTADAGSESSDTDCDDGSPSTGNYYNIYICEMNRELANKRIEASTTVTLDGSQSEPGSEDEYISEWNWDLDLNEDSDLDGDKENDADLTGETVEWKEVIPGEYKISLTVINGAGLSSTDDVIVYVSYVGQWNDFEIAGKTNNDPIDMNFDFDVVYDSDSGNTIRRTIGKLVYPQQDEGCVDTIPGEESNCRAKLDLYGFNSTEDEVSNTSEVPLSSRSGSGCDDDNDCVYLQYYSTMFSEAEHKDGDWTYTLRNDMVNTLKVESLTISLVYK